MKTISEIRFDNAQALVREVGTRADFARLLGMSDAQIWQILGGGKTRNIGNSIARRMEEACNKPNGWLDVNHEMDAAEGRFSGLATTQAEWVAANIGLSVEALEVAMAFDRIKNPAQRAAVISQLVAFNVLQIDLANRQ